MMNPPLFVVAATTAISGVCVLLLLARRRLWSAEGDEKTPPGSLGWPIVGETLSFLADVRSSPRGLYDFLLKRYAKYGPVWKTNIIGMTGVFFHGPKPFKQVMMGEHTLFTYKRDFEQFKMDRRTENDSDNDRLPYVEAFQNGHGFSYSVPGCECSAQSHYKSSWKQFKSTARILGESSMFFADEELHKRMRKQMGEPLSMESLRTNLPKFQETAISNLNSWKGRDVRVIDEGANYALDNIVYMMTSWKPGHPEFESLKLEFDHLLNGVASIPFMWLRGNYYKALKAHERMCVTLLRVVERRRKGEEMQEDFLQQLVDAEKTMNESERLTDRQVLDHLVLMMLAGHETSSITIMWMLKYLEDDQVALDTLRAEHEALLMKKEHPDAPLTWEQANSMPYTLKVLSETLRLSSFMQWLPREANDNVVIQGFKVKKGWKVFLDLRSGHHDPAIFKDPLTFNPSRFNEPLKPYSYVAFGAGPRLCLGMNLAKLEISIFIHYLVTRYRWESVGRDFTLAPYVFSKLKNGYLCRVTPIERNKQISKEP